MSTIKPVLVDQGARSAAASISILDRLLPHFYPDKNGELRNEATGIMSELADDLTEARQEKEIILHTFPARAILPGSDLSRAICERFCERHVLICLQGACTHVFAFPIPTRLPLLRPPAKSNHDIILTLAPFTVH